MTETGPLRQQIPSREKTLGRVSNKSWIVAAGIQQHQRHVSSFSLRPFIVLRVASRSPS